MWGEFGNAKVYLALGPTDLRRSINGLSVLVSEVLEADPFSESWFVFCNRKCDKLKILHWQLGESPRDVELLARSHRSCGSCRFLVS